MLSLLDSDWTEPSHSLSSFLFFVLSCTQRIWPSWKRALIGLLRLSKISRRSRSKKGIAWLYKLLVSTYREVGRLTIRRCRFFVSTSLSIHIIIHTYPANQNNHNKMVVSSLFETVVFIGVSVFQLFYVRRWFEGKGVVPTPGRTPGRQWA